MKSVNKFFFALTASVLFGCSSMDIDYDESIESSYPSDFKISEYMELHPQIVSLQIKDYVEKFNSEQELSPEEIEADKQAFLADPAVLKMVFTCPRYAGFTEADWDASMAGTEEKVLENCKVNLRYPYMNLDAVDGEGNKSVIRVFEPEVTYDTDGKTVVSLKGYAEEEKKTEVSYSISATLTLAKKQATPVSDTLQCDTNTVHKDGKLGADDIVRVSAFNALGVADDTTWLANVPLDTTVIGYQYLMFGRDHGWPYRRCKDSEKNHPVKSEEYPVKKTYCADEKGTVREI